MKKILLILSLSIIIQTKSVAQYAVNKWLLGGDGCVNPNVLIDFNPNFSSTLLPNDSIPFMSANAMITDANNNIIAITNGLNIYDSQFNIMSNGDSINTTTFANNFPCGLPTFQSHLLIQKPDNPDIYYLFHNVPFNFGVSPNCLLFSEIDATLNSGLGAVTLKHDTLFSDTLLYGRITAVKHANGRDWWVLAHELGGSTFYKLLVTPDTVQLATQNILPAFTQITDAGTACFSPDGSKYVIFNTHSKVALYDFDRCTGNLSNPKELSFVVNGWHGWGGAFSPNSRFLYISTTLYTYQYDTWASNVQASELLVASYDGFMGPIQTYFGFSLLAPDNKIYITVANGSYYLHVIESPDSLGVACNLVQHAIQLPVQNLVNMPNLPNYTLGPLVGSGCDTLTGIAALQQPINEIKIAPNPTTGVIRISSTNLKNTVCNVYNSMGELILEFNITDSNNQQLDLSTFKNGLYFIKITTINGDLIGNQKIVLAK